MNPAEQYIEIPTWPEYNGQNRVYLGGGDMPDIDDPMQSQQAAPRIGRGHRMKIQNATAQGWLEAEPGDGIVLNFLGRARGRVQKEKSPTLQGGGGIRGHSNGRE